MKLDKMTDHNADLLKVIYVMDSILDGKKLPVKVIGGFLSWARREQDPASKKQEPRPPC